MTTLGRRARALRHCGVALARGRTSATTAASSPTNGDCAGARSRPTSSRTSRTVANDGDRCFWCKTSLMDALEPIARRDGGDRRRSASTSTISVTIVPASGPRPNAVRASPSSTPASRRPTCARRRVQLGLRTWDKPAAACLASRVPYGTTVTIGVLGQVERAEARCARSASASCGVRHYGKVGAHRASGRALCRAPSSSEPRSSTRSRPRATRYVTLDLEGLRSGNLNALL